MFKLPVFPSKPDLSHRPDPEGEEGQATCEDGENLGFHAMAGAVLQFSAAMFLKTGVKQSFQLTPTSLIRLT